MRRDSLRLRWPIMAIAVALVALALPTMNAAATEARVVVAGSAPVPTNVTVVPTAMTTTFDVTLTPRSSTGLANYISSLSTRLRRTIATTSPRRSSRSASARPRHRSPRCATTSVHLACTWARSVEDVSYCT